MEESEEKKIHYTGGEISKNYSFFESFFLLLLIYFSIITINIFLVAIEHILRLRSHWNQENK